MFTAQAKTRQHKYSPKVRGEGRIAFILHGPYLASVAGDTGLRRGERKTHDTTVDHRKQSKLPRATSDILPVAACHQAGKAAGEAPPTPPSPLQPLPSSDSKSSCGRRTRSRKKTKRSTTQSKFEAYFERLDTDVSCRPTKGTQSRTFMLLHELLVSSCCIRT